MGDYANDIRKGGKRGHVQYTKEVDGIIRQNTRHFISTVGDNTFQLDELDGVVMVDVSSVAATVRLPSLDRCKVDQEIRICSVGNPGDVVNVEVFPASGDLVNEALPGGPTTIQIPFGETSSARKFQRFYSPGLDSWYIVCCLEERQ